MRVLLVAGSYPPMQCGVGDYTEKLATTLAAMPGVDVAVLTSKEGARGAKSPFEVFSVIDLWVFSAIPAFLRTIRTWKPDLVHIQYPSQAFFVSRMPSVLPLLSRLMGCRVIQTWHEPLDPRGRLRFILHILGANGLIFVRPNYFSLTPKNFRRGIQSRPYRIIPNASAIPASGLSESDRLVHRQKLANGKPRLVVFFGFIYPHKGIESLFEIANPATDSLIVAGAIKEEVYVKQLADIARSKGWSDDQIHFTGFLSQPEIADLLAAADAVVLPFLSGGGEWNTSIHSALTQGTLVITTSENPRGDEPSRNLYTAEPSAISEMREALDRLAGRRIPPASVESKWQEIAEAHLAFYRQCL